MLKATALLLTLLISVTPASAAPPVKARILSGIGILLISKVQTEERTAIIIYKEPSLGRITTIEEGRLPLLSQSISSPDGLIPVIVTSKKSGWYRIIYDDGEREGWIEGRSAYKFRRWEELLRNRPAALIGGLRKEFYTLRREAKLSAEQLDTVEKGFKFTSQYLDGDWIRVNAGSQTQGWLRWRDDNSRLVISIIL